MQMYRGEKTTQKRKSKRRNSFAIKENKERKVTEWKMEELKEGSKNKKLKKKHG